ncbi:fumarylacetoacetate hydrolase family protein [Actinacidiphila rubida]|uniref:2-dehydro-3-deoxy-D-arabinonate dehydratase n=1 Tax=Actinacidiphila rubida TaxID=310780 RepID=A0A1H8JIK4_9ACTN|nr:fumarylacetoacetate hydrolase family protein [Actinacidiphila rubida]SEN80599.1 2-dehydro-3-deoxy-D-arabinonate dehydratase [Actinacidiphila rubida]
MTRIVRFADRSGSPQTGVLDAAGAVHAFGEPRVAGLLQERVEELRARVESALAAPATHAAADVLLLPPLDGRMEVWAAGVTYERSREARVAESTEQTVYERVYDAERPELFFKSVPWRVVTDGEPIAVRPDSALDVPEPELGLVVNRYGETVGYLIVDDVSSRAIEGENPLYLPQAKIYAGSCAVSSAFVPAWELADPGALGIRMTVWRDGAAVFEGATTTAAFHRAPEDLVGHLTAAQPFPDGVVLSTGTGIVPGLDFTLTDGDVVEIGVDGLGTLTNPVVGDPGRLAWLAEAADRPALRAAHRGPAASGVPAR